MKTYRIDKSIELNASVARVWRALTDYREFGEWFRVKLEGPFVAGEEARGKITHPGYEHVVWRAVIQKIQPENYFSFTWHPYGVDPNYDYSQEQPTLIEFRLEQTPHGTMLYLSETGFENVPEARRMEALRMNDRGWTAQMTNIKNHVEKQT